jgi:hypothetical protein
MTEKECLLKQFKELAHEFRSALKSGQKALCEKLRLQLAEICVRARQLGIPLGCSSTRTLQTNDLTYSLNALEFVTRNLGTEDADIILKDIHQLNGCESCGRCTEPTIIRTMIGYDVVEAELKDGVIYTKFPEPTHEEKPNIPDHPITRSIDIQRGFSMETFTPPTECDPDTCPNVFCESRKLENKGLRCIYAPPLTNAEINQRNDEKWQKPLTNF